MEYSKSKIISNEILIDGIYKMVVEEKNSIKPGQFYMLKTYGETLLPRPISVSERDDNTITFLYAVVGTGTKDFSKLKAGDYIDLTGPLGNGFKTDGLGKVALVTGGIGIAPMLEVAKDIKRINKENIIDLYAGFREDIYLVEDMRKYLDKVNISTDTGKHGHKGFVTDMIKVEDYDTILCCGPEIMMNKLVNMCREKNVNIYVSMEKHMACGVGACLGCTCKTKEGNKRTCKDGPVFDGDYLDI
jgi:dihydroorotate dehydrogenase electron transfer subunit